MNDLPSPLTPPDCDLKDFQFIPVDVHRLLTSETWVLGTGEERAAAITLWLASWHQVPAASVPKDDRMLAHLSQCKNWKKVKAHALRGWIEASDSRLYHPVVAEKALEAWIEKLANSLSGTAGNAKRWGLSLETESIRQRAVVAISMLRVLAPQSKTLKKKLVAVIEAGSQTESGGDGQQPSGGDRNRQGQGQGQGTPSVPNGTGGKPPKVTDPDEIIFGYGVPLLTAAGSADKDARSFLGKLRKVHGDDAVIEKLRQCLREKPLQPLTWLAAALPPNAPEGKLNRQESLEQKNQEVAARLAAAGEPT